MEILLILQQTIEIDRMQSQKMVVSAAAIYRNGVGWSHKQNSYYLFFLF